MKKNHQGLFERPASAASKTNSIRKSGRFDNELYSVQPPSKEDTVKMLCAPNNN